MDGVILGRAAALLNQSINRIFILSFGTLTYTKGNRQSTNQEEKGDGAIRRDEERKRERSKEARRTGFLTES